MMCAKETSLFRRLQGKEGFTLTELLTSMAILGVMAAILTPVLSSARESARKSSCASNQRQLGVAFLAYSDDYKGSLPASVVQQAPGHWVPWDQLLMPYIQETKTFKCPVDSVRRNPGAKARSYSMNDQMYLKYLQWTGRGTKLNQIPGIADYVLLSEWHIESNTVGSISNLIQFFPPNAEQYYHNQRSGNNFLFYDGHVKYYQYGQLNLAKNYIFYNTL